MTAAEAAIPRRVFRRRSSTSTSLQFAFSPSLSPPAISSSPEARPRGFSEVSQLGLNDEQSLDVGSSTSSSSYRLQTPATPEWSWAGGVRIGAGGGKTQGSDAPGTEDDETMPLTASPSSARSAGAAMRFDAIAIGRQLVVPTTSSAGPSQQTPPSSRTRPRAATDLQVNPRPGNRDRSMSLSNILRQKLQRTDTDEKPRWRTLLKRNDSSARLSSRDVSGTSSTTSLASPEIPAKRPGLMTRTSTALSVSKRSKSNISLTLPRSVSVVHTPDMVVPVDVPLPEPQSYFELLLPKELQLLIIRTLLQSWEATGGSGRWSGKVGGRRELIKLSRVNKAWEELVFDGQLWTDLHLTPFVHYLAPGTLRRMLSHSAPFVRTLNLHGLRNLQGTHFSSALAPLGPFRFQSIDLRGCRKLGTAAVNRLLEQCPEVKHLNLKGLHAVETSTLQVIAAHHTKLETLDLSRCANISFGDLLVMLSSLKGRESMIHELRMASLKGYGPTASQLIPSFPEALPHLTTLDLQGCPHVFNGTFRDLAAAYSSSGNKCKIKHLNISSCSELSGEALSHMLPHLEQLEILEMAGYGDRLKDAGLLAVIGFAPNLRKLDLDNATAITDAVLMSLAKSRVSEGVEVQSKLQAIVLSYAKDVTSEGMLRLIRGCPDLVELNVDNTVSNAEVMDAYFERRQKNATISLIDCRAITAAAQADTVKRLGSRARKGWPGYEYRPFAYTSSERDETRPVLKTFQAWKAIDPPKGWIEMLPDKPVNMGLPAAAVPARSEPRRSDFDEGMSCVMM